MGLPIIDDHALWNDYWSQRDNSDAFLGGDLSSLCGQIERGAGRGSLLDIGCGDGRLVQALCAKGTDARGLDISSVALEAAEKRCPSRFTQGSILDYNPAQCHFDIITCINCLEHLSEDQVPHALSTISRLARCAFYLTVAIKSSNPLVKTLQTREWWETRCFEAGFRRHPNIFHVMPYDEAIGNVTEITILLEPLPNNLAEAFSIHSLAEERTLHMDMAREAGSRSDAHMMRYHIAAQHIRPGDRVLDAACGLGYGSRMLRHQSLCASVLGIDGSDYAINYAIHNYGEVGRVDFQVGFLPEVLDIIEPGSIDFIASFETLEHLREPIKFLAACRKVLSPGGRIMVSVPHDWTEADGKDPNPHHFHVYDWPSLLEQVSEHFALEKAFCQTANRRKRANTWVSHGREWKEVDLQDASTCESEWCLVLAMADPIDATQPYVDRHHLNRSGETVPTVLDFAGQYRNPWLVSSLISIGLRTENSKLRLEMANRLTLNDQGADSAAARCVEGYYLLAHAGSPEPVHKWVNNIAAHVAPRDWQSAPPIDVRWAISLLYLQALLQRKIGELDGALASFETITKLPFLKYSPLIATKVVDAYYELGMAAWVSGDGNTAREFFLNGLETAKIAVTTKWDQAFGPLDKMPRFITSELSEILDLSTRCAVGAHYALCERPTGWIALNVAWNQKFQITKASGDLKRIQKELETSNDRASRYIAEVNSAHFQEFSRLNQVISSYEDAKKKWYEPQLLKLQDEIEHLRDVLQSYEDTKATWYEPQLLELRHEVERLNEVLQSYEDTKATWYEPQLLELRHEVERLNEVLQGYEDTKATWYEPQLLELRHEVERLNEVLQSYEDTKATWYEPQLLELRHEVERLNEVVERHENTKATWYEPQLLELRHEVERLNEVVERHENAKATWYEPRLQELHYEFERLSEVVERHENAKSTWYEPQLLNLQLEIERLNGEVADFRKVRTEWFEPQLESRGNRITELETALLQAQTRYEETERTNRSAYEAELERLQSKVGRLEDEVNALQFPRIIRTYGAKIFSALTFRLF
ncbi:class I SAM-dependent methyltransferase [Agrobacterium vitis]|uniref:class I SAM-dependent methyltransferase n=1 Tax=Agrobacterium vitis TaxID=373 RepID=UPI0009BFE18F|nr:class I SAM-dependent methyltransferase [Agrobacterium vitis]MCE6077185.1 methyltransferase domain-containing protein [Agrobacterium vitis]MCM2469093.1 methyltransferase domain-containing protein [Agrobacterium vitis]MUO69506.1 methyltransferase domain-containing protein [Agrobacterium vitis]MUO87358.1 methyltransferase domain-containing protein [Agrobacterium vitis]